ncbi:MAG: hypothetical protein II413_12370, partial [Treponema sp.]|nr:hypothetical protein [Treponema sp.]
NASSEYEQNFNDFLANHKQSIVDIEGKTEESRKKVQHDIDLLNEKADDALRDYQDRSNVIMASLQKQFDDMVTKTENMLVEATNQADRQISTLKRDVKESTENDKLAYQKMLDRMNADTDNLQTRIDEINKGIANFTKQTGLFEQADTLKSELVRSITTLKSEITSLTAYQNKVADLMAQIDKVQAMSADFDRQIANYNAQRATLDSLDQKFSQLMATSANMDAKIADLKTTSDNLVNMQVTVRNFQDSLETIQQQYDRLETQADSIDQVGMNVDATARDIENLENRLAECGDQLQDLPDQIGGLQDQLNAILNDNGRLNEAVDKMTNLQSLIEETEDRIQNLTKSKEGIAKTEKRLMKLNEDAEKKIGILQTIAKADVKKKTSSGVKKESGNGLTPQIRNTVKDLKRRYGWSNREIAEKVKINEDLVDLILETQDPDEE